MSDTREPRTMGEALRKMADGLDARAVDVRYNASALFVDGRVQLVIGYQSSARWCRIEADRLDALPVEELSEVDLSADDVIAIERALRNVDDTTGSLRAAGFAIVRVKR